MIVPSIIPGPVRVVVIVTEFAPVSIFPAVMFNVATLILLFRLTTLAVPLPTVSTLNVVAPDILASSVPFKESVDVDAENTPLFTKFPARLWVNVPASNVVPAPIVNVPLITRPAAGVLVLPFCTIMLLNVV